MSNPAKRKGTVFETDIVNYINEVRLHAKRTGSALVDEGDIHFGLYLEEGEWTIEAKNHQDIDLPGYLDQLEKSLARRSAIPFKGVVAVKHRGKGTGEAYAVMRMERFRQLAAYVIMLEELTYDLGVGVLPHLSHPDNLREYLGGLAPGDPDILGPLFGEFTVPEEMEVLADGSEVPAGEEVTVALEEEAPVTGEPCIVCGKIHTQQENRETIEILKELFGWTDSPEVEYIQLDDTNTGSPVTEWENTLPGDSEPFPVDPESPGVSD